MAPEPTAEQITGLERFRGPLEEALNLAVAAQAADPIAWLAQHFGNLNVAAPKSEEKRMQAVSQDAKCMLDHLSKLSIYSDPTAVRGTGIICTIGPKTMAVEKLTMLRETGLNIVRMNFSHGSHEYHGQVIANARASIAADPLDKRLVAIALDTKGPEIRTGTLKEGSGDTVALAKGATVAVVTDPALLKECSAEQIFMDYANLPKVMRVGGTIFIDDGLMALEVRSIDEEAGTMSCEVMNGGELGSHKGVNLPNVDVDLPALSEKDKADLAFAVAQNCDMIFASFIRKAADVREVRACLMAAHLAARRSRSDE